MGDDQHRTRGKIQKLPQHLINRIAAGEIVERPASVVKELVENSLDAGASSVSISVSKGGLQSISVLDDGDGMNRQDLHLAVEPHATSKISTSEQLKAIDTLGFRGEALASIASVSDLEICARQPDARAGASLRVRGGEKQKIRPWGGPVGTRVRVRNLFFNAPVRRRQMKRASTEMSYIMDTVRGMALANPDVAFQLHHNDSESLFTSGSGELKQCVVEIFGAEAVSEMSEFGDPDGRVYGFAGSPALARSRRDRQYFILNDRIIEHDALRAVVQNCYRGFLEGRRYPFCIVVVEIPHHRVDVNVHPAKREVRIENVRELTGILHNEVRRVLMALPAPRWEAANADLVGSKPPTFNGDKKQAGLQKPQVAEGQISYLAGRDHDDQGAVPFGQLRPLGQIDRTYILAEGPDGLYIIDQHATCERLFYERALARLKDAAPASQKMVTPYVYTPAAEEIQLWRRYGDHLRQIGFEVEIDDSDNLVVKGVPAYTETPVSPTEVGTVLSALQDSRDNLPPGEKAAAAVASCHAALRAGDELSMQQMQQLLGEMADLCGPQTCPHGRPTAVVITNGQMARMFERR